MLGFKVSLKSNIKGYSRRMQDTGQKNLQAATVEWYNGIVQDQLTGSRSGRSYRIPGTKKRYTASKPGQAPASRTGTLRSSYRFQISRRGGDPVGEVGSPEEYALYLEKGTDRMAPRPHVQPAYKGREGPIKAHLGRTWF